MSFTFNAVTGLQPPFDVLDEQIVDVPAGYHFHVRNRYLKILFFIHGEGKLRVNDDEPMQLRPGNSVVFSDACDQFYLSDSESKGCRIHGLRLLLSRASLAENGRRPSKAAKADTALLRDLFSGVRHFPGEQNPEILSLVATLRSEAETKRPGYRLRLSAICLEICVLLARALEAKSAAPMSTLEIRRFSVEKLKSFIITNVHRPLTLDEIAWQADWSGAHLARVFRRVTGESVFDYLQRVRIIHAKNLLVSTSLPINRIAMSIGFSSPAVFARSFLKATGTTARVYRNTQRPGWVVEELQQHGENYSPGSVEEMRPRRA